MAYIMFAYALHYGDQDIIIGIISFVLHNVKH